MGKGSRANRYLHGLFNQLDAIYARMPTVACKGLCSVACGSVPLSDLEARRMQLVSHRKPRTTADGICAYLTIDKRCSVYAVRPAICRAWGVLQTLSCMHGCAPAQWMLDDEFLRIVQEI